MSAIYKRLKESDIEDLLLEAGLIAQSLQLPGTTVYDILNLSAQKYICENVNHLNLYCALFAEDIVVKNKSC